MNYFEIINKCLVELGYKQVSAFSELIKNDHKKLKNAINMVNHTICRFDNWAFLVREKEILLNSGENEIKNDVNGRIITLRIDDKNYDYLVNFQDYISKPIPVGKFTAYGEKLILPEFNEDKIIKIAYYTKNTAANAQGTEKFNMEEETDVSLIPDLFAEPLLVYGACLRLKANPQHIKFSYWYSMYKEALADIKALSSVSAVDLPHIKLLRE